MGSRLVYTKLPNIVNKMFHYDHRLTRKFFVGAIFIQNALYPCLHACVFLKLCMCLQLNIEMYLSRRKRSCNYTIDKVTIFGGIYTEILLERRG